jgi:tetratricopeptide (TPR) repeat protein
MKLPFAALMVLAVAATASARAAADDTLTGAQGLYEQAAYEQALAVLNRLDPKRTTLEEGQSIRRYRALCLLALGRSTEAEVAVEDMVRTDPAAAVTDDLPPRLQALLQQVRGRVIRDVVRQGYERGRDLYQRGEFESARAEFNRIITLLDDQSVGLAKDPAFADIRLLADGFLRLAMAAPAAVQNTAATAAAPPTPAAHQNGSTPAGTQNEQVPSGNPAFVPPEAIVQDIPPFPRASGAPLTRNEGELEIEVSADGRVTRARVMESIHPVYDVILAAAAKNWRYHPARRYGEPVASTKRVHVRLQLK